MDKFYAVPTIKTGSSKYLNILNIIILFKNLK